jgi:hypothetical protein
MSGRPAPVKSSGGTAGRVVFGLSIVVGLSLTLYRNDLLRDAASSAGMTSNYQKLESALGGPGFGTPRAVDALVMPASLSEAIRAAQQPVASRRTSSSQHDSSPAKTDSTGSSTQGSASSGSAGERHNSDRRTQGSSAPRAKSDEAPAKGLGLKGSSNKFDPLNGKL